MKRWMKKAVSTTKVTNLNADKLDGLDTAFLKHILATAANDFW